MDDLTELAATPEQVALANRFLGLRCAFGRSLVIPMRVLWREYRRWSPSASAVGLRVALELQPTVAVVENPSARGRLKTLVLGIGVMASPQVRAA